MSISCGRSRLLLWPDDTLREATAESVEAQAHFNDCLACREFFEEMRGTAALIGRGIPRVVARPEVRERLFRSVARARVGPPVRRRWPRWSVLAAAAAALVLAVGLWRASAQRQGPDAIAAFAEDHQRAAAGPGIQTTEASTAANWLRERLPFAIHVPLLPHGRVAGARLCLMAGMHGGVVEYRIGAQALSYFVLPADARAPEGTALELRSAMRAGYRVVAWREGELVHALVADLPEATMRELARICMEQGIGRLSAALVARAAEGKSSRET